MNYYRSLFSLKYTIWLAFILLCSINQTSYAQKPRNVSFSKSSLKMIVQKAEDSTEYQRIDIKDLILSGEPGKPELPAKYIHLLIPSEEDINNIIVNVKKSEVIKLSKKVFPSQPPIPTSNYFEGNKFVKPDPEIYNSDNPFPQEIVRVTDDGYFNGSKHIVSLEIYPWRYYPKLDKLEFISDLDFSFVMKPSKKQPLYTSEWSGKNKEIYDNALKHIIDNVEDIPLYSNMGQGGSLAKITTDPLPAYEYIVITTNTLAPYFDNFINWKKRKGLNIGLVTVEQIISAYMSGGGDKVSGIEDSAGCIRQYLKDSYYNNTPPNKTMWALLGGDYRFVPVRYGCGERNFFTLRATDDYKIPADLYFADFNGDWDVDHDFIRGVPVYGEIPYPGQGDNPEYDADIFVGRLICSSGQDILNWTNKLILYEQNPGKGDATYLTKSFMFESDEMQYGNEAEQVSSVLTSFTSQIYRELPS